MSRYEQCVTDATGRCVRWSHQHDDEMCDPCAEGRHAMCDNGYNFCDCCGGS